MPSVFPQGHTGESIQFDLDGPSDAPIRIYRDSADGEAYWESLSVDEVLREFTQTEAKQLLDEALRFGQGEFHREGDQIIYQSQSIPSCEIVYEVVDKDFRDAGENEQGDENGGVLAREILAREGLIRYNSQNKFATDEHQKMFQTALSNRTDAKGIFPN